MADQAENQDTSEDQVEEDLIDGEEGGDDATPTFTQQQLNDIVQRRISRESKKSGEADAAASEAAERARLAEEKARILELALQQKNEAALSPDNFDLGEHDPEYVKQRDAQTFEKLKAETARVIDERLQQTQQQQSEAQQAAALQQAQRSHYERANSLKAKDYIEVEDAAIEAIGPDAHNVIVTEFEHSEAIMYYLGKNPAEANDIAKAIKNSPVKALKEITLLEQRIKPKQQSSNAPNPEEKLEGASPSIGEVLERKLAMLQKQYSERKIDINELMKRRKELRAA